MTRRLSRHLPPGFLVAVAIAVGFGLIGGALMGYIQSIQNLAALLAPLVALATAIAVGVIVVVGLLTLMIGGAPAGLRVLALAPALVGGVLLGYAIGPKWESGTAVVIRTVGIRSHLERLELVTAFETTHQSRNSQDQRIESISRPIPPTPRPS